jgi:hypothetical protein
MPGPGHFYPTVEVVKPKNPGYSMRTIVNRPATELEKNPGPGSYQNESPINSKNKKVHSSAMKRTGKRYIPGTDKEKNLVPGPGSYKQEAMIGNHSLHVLPTRNPAERFV